MCCWAVLSLWELRRVTYTSLGCAASRTPGPHGLLYPWAVQPSVLLPSCKSVQLTTVLKAVGRRGTVLSICVSAHV